MAVEVLGTLIDGEPPVRISAYDGSAIGPPDTEFGLHIANDRGLSYLLTAPGDLGLTRAYVSGDLELRGVHPGDPYDALRVLAQIKLHRPSPAEALTLVRGPGWERLRLPAPPPEEAPPRWRRTADGMRHSRGRDARAVQHHYDVSNEFYANLLGPSMTYTCAVYRSPSDTLEDAQAAKNELVAGKLGLKPGMRRPRTARTETRPTPSAPTGPPDPPDPPEPVIMRISRRQGDLKSS